MMSCGDCFSCDYLQMCGIPDDWMELYQQDEKEEDKEKKEGKVETVDPDDMSWQWGWTKGDEE
jgi:hypothetical protein